MYYFATVIFRSKYCINAYIFFLQLKPNRHATVRNAIMVHGNIYAKYNNILEHNSKYLNISILHICKQIYPREDCGRN